MSEKDICQSCKKVMKAKNIITRIKDIYTIFVLLIVSKSA
jgi:hypothetical protein